MTGLINLINAKGTRDSSPEEALKRARLTRILTSAFETFGFAPLETPVLERLELLQSKYAGGDEILREIFALRDQGKRRLALRYDLTVPLCRYVGSHPELKMPFKRYQLGPVFRDGPVKFGRYREFWQCDVDIVGCRAMAADAEIIALAGHALRQIEHSFSTGHSFIIKVNNRKLLNSIIARHGIRKNHESIILALDKLEKTGEKEVRKELSAKGLSQKQTAQLLRTVSLRGEKGFAAIKEMLGRDDEGVRELEELFTVLRKMKVKNAVFDPSLARGLAYYTGTVFEAFLAESPIKSSVCAGGRYDEMIGRFLGSRHEFPAIGISFGLDVLADSLSLAHGKEKKHDKEKKRGRTTQEKRILPVTVTTVFVAGVGRDEKIMDFCLELVSRLRSSGINTEIDLLGKGPSRNLDYANSKGIPFVAFVGDDELKAKKVQCKDMISGKQEQLSVDALVKKLTLRSWPVKKFIS